MKRLLRHFSAVAAVGLLAAGCVTPQPPPPTPPPNAGVYKIGNPYQVNGIWYYPREQPDYDDTGIASWYGKDFHGKYTADGEIYDTEGLTAAHPTLPMPVNVQVTNLDNGHSLVLRVNDRGPFAKGRIIDVSERAARLLGFHDQGTAKVRVVFLGRADLPSGQPQPFGAGLPDTVVTAAAAAPAVKVEVGNLPEVPGTRASTGATAPPPVKVKTTPETPSAAVKPTGQVVQVPVPAVTHLYVQVGAFGNIQNARRLAALLGGDLRLYPVQKNGATIYRVRLGPFDNLSDADAALARMTAAGSTDAQIVVDQ
jgi:rare lipoprotein A